MPSPATILPAVDREMALPDYDLYIDSTSIEALAEALRTIETMAHASDLTDAGGARAARLAVQALREGTPFSLVRIGDGEGNMLGALDASFPLARRFSTQQILVMMFGTPDFSVSEIKAIQTATIASVLSADVLGVSDPVRISRLQTLRQSPAGREDIRGYMGSYESIRQVETLLKREDHRPSLVVSNYVHRQMMSHFAAIIRAASEITLIGPYDLRSALCNAYDVQNIQTILIPNQASSSPGEGLKWYPDGYARVLSACNVRPGGLFLVSAGILGKPLCHEIRQANGVALDIGSVVDVWFGKPVRNYHNAEFMNQHRLVLEP